ncbi:NXPE family member 3-like [Halichoeres trimaculatus]|uniref:NXPE family member 3-like n=1 Tax=Halichoeres trimaculatus TaxID=147232 RepID=UPI003D9DD696
MKTVTKMEDFMKQMVGVYSLKFCSILLCLATFLVMFMLRNRNLLEHKNNFFSIQRVTTDPPTLQDFCTFKPLSPADALEEQRILDSIAWPEAPLPPAPPSFEQTSDPAHSNFSILPRRGGGEWRVGDHLEVLIKLHDFQGQAKKTGGDFLVAGLHSKSLGAGVAGRVVDHLNGSYSAVFPLLWEGDAQVEVIFVHPREGVTFLQRLNKEQPGRVPLTALFQSGSHSESTLCSVCLRPTSRLQCNFTDLRTGEPWFCYKPQNLSCDTRRASSKRIYTPRLKNGEEKLFQGGINMKVYINASGSDSVTVLPPREGKTRFTGNKEKSEVSGYYYQGLWRALDGTVVRQFKDSSTISQCLKGKMVHMYGDSTIRQWFEYLDASLPGAKQFDLGSSKQAGPLMMSDSANNFLVTFRCHGPPLRFGTFPTSQMRYIANELDLLSGGPNTVVVIGIWSHFSTFPIELYIRRLQNIRRAVLRLLARAPETLVVIRTGNLKALNLYQTITNSDWFSSQRNKVLRAIFKGVNVQLIDAWEMVLAHHLPHSLHPQPPIIENMINVLFSYMCPKK